MDLVAIKQVVEAALFVADEALSPKELKAILSEESVSMEQLKQALAELEAEYQPRGIQLIQCGGVYRFQSKPSLSPILSRLWQERAPKYSRALLETLALVAYRQPITRGQIEKVRGVSVSSNIIRTLLERGWIKVVGHKQVPGRPALYGTTNLFLQYFNLDSLGSLPPLDDEEALASLLNSGHAESETR